MLLQLIYTKLTDDLTTAYDRHTTVARVSKNCAYMGPLMGIF